MIEVRIIRFLKGRLTAPVYAELPEELPDRFVVIDRTGTSMENHIYESTVALQCYGSSMLEAGRLCDEVVELMLYGFPAVRDIGRVALNSAGNTTDTSIKRYRYQAMFDVVHCG